MIMGRKTIEVEKMLEFANERLAWVSESNTPEMRWGVIVMIEEILHKSGNYNGFRYLDNYDLPAEVLPGVRRAFRQESYGDCLSYEDRFKNTDETRRYYY
jgi:hypothetical protein